MQAPFSLKRPALLSYLHFAVIAGLIIWCSVKTSNDVVVFKNFTEKRKYDALKFLTPEDKIREKTMIHLVSSDDSRQKVKSEAKTPSVVRRTDDYYNAMQQEQFHENVKVADPVQKVQKPSVVPEKQELDLIPPKVEPPATAKPKQDEKNLEKSQPEEDTLGQATHQQGPQEPLKQEVVHTKEKTESHEKKPSTSDSEDDLEYVVLQGDEEDYAMTGQLTVDGFE